MPFRTALSGLNASSAELRVIGNNVANASTVGFKESRAEFADIFASSNLGVTANAIGSGVRLSAVSQQFNQGNIGFTDNNLDLAVSGQGFFILDDNGISNYTRAGAFGVDRQGFVVNNQAQQLTVFQADANGTITGATGPLQLDRSDIAPQDTTSIDVAANINAAAAVPVPAVPTTAITLGGAQLDDGATPFTTAVFDIYDGLGTQIPGATLTFAYTGTADLWDITLTGAAATVPPTVVNNVNIGTDIATLNWDPDGVAGQDIVNISVDTRSIASNTGGGNSVTAVSANIGTPQGTFDPTNANTYNNSTSLTIFDSQGSSHLMTMYFRKNGLANQWEVFNYVDGVERPGPSGPGNPEILEFNPNGTLNTTTFIAGVLDIQPFDPGGGPANLDITVDFNQTTQYGSGFNVNSLVQDGFTTGRLSGIDISETGVITSRFTNGQSRTLGQVALANFNNPQGLRQLGDTSWSESFDSGAPLIGTGGSGSLGLIESGALEGSNVDLTEQLVGMITAQRNFQANAQVITTADTVTQTIINIR